MRQPREHLKGPAVAGPRPLQRGQPCARALLVGSLVVLGCSAEGSSDSGESTLTTGGANGNGSGLGGSGPSASTGTVGTDTSSADGESGTSSGSTDDGSSAGSSTTSTTSTGATTTGGGGAGGNTSNASSNTNTAGSSTGGPAPGGAVTIDGRHILVGGEVLHLRGVNWNPVPQGGSHPQDLAYAEFADQDIALMQNAGINAVRTYEPLTDTIVLDALAAAGIFVLNTVYPYGGNAVDSVDAPVDAVKDHPAILLWLIGNEWNYNGLYVDLSLSESIARINEVATRLRSLDGAHPIATVYGELPDSSVLQELESIDVWGLNVYSGLGFGSRFDEWASLSDKPMFFGEYGADAWNAITGQYDPESQALATRDLTTEIIDNSTLGGGVCSGGAIFEFADEWWKDGNGSPSVQDVGGIAPGGGPYPDSTFNEEYWGIVDIDRVPRPAYQALKELYAP